MPPAAGTAAPTAPPPPKTNAFGGVPPNGGQCFRPKTAERGAMLSAEDGRTGNKARRRGGGEAPPPRCTREDRRSRSLYKRQTTQSAVSLRPSSVTPPSRKDRHRQKQNGAGPQRIRRRGRHAFKRARSARPSAREHAKYPRQRERVNPTRPDNHNEDHGARRAARNDSRLDLRAPSRSNSTHGTRNASHVPRRSATSRQRNQPNKMHAAALRPQTAHTPRAATLGAPRVGAAAPQPRLGGRTPQTPGEVFWSARGRGIFAAWIGTGDHPPTTRTNAPALENEAFSDPTPIPFAGLGEAPHARLSAQSPPVPSTLYAKNPPATCRPKNGGGTAKQPTACVPDKAPEREQPGNRTRPRMPKTGLLTKGIKHDRQRPDHDLQ